MRVGARRDARAHCRAVAGREPGARRRSAAWPASALAAVLIEVAAPLVPGLPFTSEITLNLRVLAFATAAALGRLDPGRAAAGDPDVRRRPPPRRSTTRRAARPARNDRARRAIVAAEVAVSVVLICGAALLFKSLARMQQVDVGARIDRVITMAIDLPRARYPSGHHLRGVLSDR